MTMSCIHRRTLLRGLGGIALGLPLLEVMGEQSVEGATETAKRFVAVYTPGGTVLDRWRPTGSETSFDLSPILSPLEALKEHLLILDGLDMPSAVGEQHQAGIIAWLTGTKQSSQHGDFAAGPSIDQVIANLISQGQAYKSLELAVRWATGKSNGLLHPINVVNFQDNGSFDPIPPRLDPVDIFEDLFGSVDPESEAATERRIARKRSILDYVDRRYDALSKKLGARDQQKLEEHLEKIRELERSLESVVSDQCQPPEVVDTSDYDPGVGSTGNTTTDAAIPAVGRYMMDMLVMALTCDLTSVATLQWTDTEAKHTFPWLGLSEHHHFYQHDGGFRPDQCEQIYTWYSEQHAYLLQKMADTEVGDHSLLDESVVFFGSELQSPPSHSKANMPFLLAGRGGGLRSGRWAQYGGASHNDLLVSVLSLFGDERTTFGDPEFCTGPLAGVT